MEFIEQGFSQSSGYTMYRTADDTTEGVARSGCLGYQSFLLFNGYIMERANLLNTSSYGYAYCLQRLESDTASDDTGDRLAG